MIKTQNLSKVFYSGFFRREIKALDNLNLEIQPNEIFGFLGPNGAGKTTTIKLFTGLLKPSHGKIEIFNQDASSCDVHSRLGYMPENPYFYEYLTAWEILDYYGQLCRVGDKIRHKRINELLVMVELDKFKNRLIRNFSKGMLQRLGLAQALINDPELLILDEPMDGMDPAGRKKIRDIMRDLKQRGKTIFFSTHILWDVELVCDRVGILLDGKLKNIGKLDEMLEGGAEVTEIVFRDVTPEGMMELKKNFGRVIEKGNEILVKAQNEQEVEAALTLVNQKKAGIFSLNPERKTLEEIFIKETAKESSKFKNQNAKGHENEKSKISNCSN